MTLVAGISVGGMPAFIGDLLTSWSIPTKVELPTQTHPSIHRSADGFFAAGLTQKLVIVRSYLMICWAGSLSVAEALVRDLDKILPMIEADFLGREDDLLSRLNCLPDTVEVVALLIYKGALQPLCVHVRGFELDRRRFYLLGSGGDTFFRFAEYASGVIPEGEDAEAFVARAVVLNFAANAMMAQFVSGYGLSELWGGGFEIAYPTRRGFKKVDGILIRCWNLCEDGQLGNVGISFLLHYQGSTLYVTSFGEAERSTVVPSWLGEDGTLSSRTVVPEWSIDLFTRSRDNAKFLAVQYEFPHSRARSMFQFRRGELVAWEMSKSRVDKLIERISEADPTATPFIWSRI